MDEPKRVETFKDSELVYAAYARCPCGEGLAYVSSRDDMKYWDCAGILTGRAPIQGQEGATTHCAQYPFIFYEIKSENQPSAAGATTRPKVV